MVRVAFSPGQAHKLGPVPGGAGAGQGRRSASAVLFFTLFGAVAVVAIMIAAPDHSGTDAEKQERAVALQTANEVAGDTALVGELQRLRATAVMTPEQLGAAVDKSLVELQRLLLGAHRGMCISQRGDGTTL